MELINSALTSVIKNYSYLALVAGITCEADYIFVPEDPIAPDWKDNICKKITQVFYVELNLLHLYFFFQINILLISILYLYLKRLFFCTVKYIKHFYINK